MTLYWSNPSSRMAKWALELFEFNLVFRSRPCIKVQVLIDFMTECTVPEEESEGGDPILEELENQWVVYVDRALNANSLGVGLILTIPEGEDI